MTNRRWMFALVIVVSAATFWVIAGIALADSAVQYFVPLGVLLSVAIACFGGLVMTDE